MSPSALFRQAFVALHPTLGALLALFLGYGCTATVIEEIPGRVGEEEPPRIQVMDGSTEPPRTDPPAAAPDTSTPRPDAGSQPPADTSPPPTPDTSPPPPKVDEGCGTAIEREELALTNAARAESGLPPLTCDVGLTLAARKHCEDMCRLGYFSHSSADGRAFSDRIREEGVVFGSAAENIAKGQETAEWVHDSWMRSSGHRRNILDGSYRRIGIGYAACGGEPLWTQNFTD